MYYMSAYIRLSTGFFRRCVESWCGWVEGGALHHPCTVPGKTGKNYGILEGWEPCRVSAHLCIGYTNKGTDGLDDKIVLLCLFNQVL